MRKCLDDEIELCSGNFYLSILRAIASLSNWGREWRARIWRWRIEKIIPWPPEKWKYGS
jgi:hypothetical protein